MEAGLRIANAPSASSELSYRSGDRGTESFIVKMAKIESDLLTLTDTDFHLSRISILPKF